MRFYVVSRERFELSPPFTGAQILSLVCLPFHHLELKTPSCFSLIFLNQKSMPKAYTSCTKYISFIAVSHSTIAFNSFITMITNNLCWFEKYPGFTIFYSFYKHYILHSCLPPHPALSSVIVEEVAARSPTGLLL